MSGHTSSQTSWAGPTKAGRAAGSLSTETAEGGAGGGEGITSEAGTPWVGLGPTGTVESLLLLDTILNLNVSKVNIC